MPKVLVVDDSLSVRKVVQRALESKRIEVLSAASGNEALEQIAREAPDLIVCDVIMPDMDGYQICDYVKKHPTLGPTPVLLISGIVNGTVLERAAKVRA
ncbi:MAG TPA: response regulator, partial [Methylomirabilota bacterium]